MQYIKTIKNDNGSIDHEYRNINGDRVFIWYNRTERSWVTMIVDETHGYQCGSSDYNYDKATAIQMGDYMTHSKYICTCKDES